MERLKAGQRLLLEDGSTIETEEGDSIQEAEEKKDSKEAENSIKAIIDTEWSKEDEKGKALGLFKGLLFSEDPKAKKFMAALDKMTSGMKAESYI